VLGLWFGFGLGLVVQYVGHTNVTCNTTPGYPSI